MTVVTFLPFPPDLHLPFGVLLQSQIFDRQQELCQHSVQHKKKWERCCIFLLGQQFAGTSGHVFSLENETGGKLMLKCNSVT